MTQIDLEKLKRLVNLRVIEDQAAYNLLFDVASAYLASQSTNGDAPTVKMLKGVEKCISSPQAESFRRQFPALLPCIVQTLNEARCNSTRVVGNLELGTRIIEDVSAHVAAKVEVQAPEAQTRMPLTDEKSILEALDLYPQDNFSSLGSENYENKRELLAYKKQQEKDAAEWNKKYKNIPQNAALHITLLRNKINDLEAALQRPSVNDDLIKSHDTLLNIAYGVQGYWTTSNDCLDSQSCVDEAINNAEKLKERLDK